MANRFSGMHELARHITHETEVLDVAARTLSSILRSQRDYCEGFRKTSVCTESHRSIEVSEQLIQNLGLRARAFDKRLRNEIKLVGLPCASRRMVDLPERISGLIST